MAAQNKDDAKARERIGEPDSMHEHWNESQGWQGKAEEDVDSDDVVIERAAEGQRCRRIFVRRAPVDDIEYKFLPIGVSQHYLEELINCGKTRAYMTYYDTDKIHVEFITGDTPVKVTEWNRQ